MVVTGEVAIQENYNKSQIIIMENILLFIYFGQFWEIAEKIDLIVRVHFA